MLTRTRSAALQGGVSGAFALLLAGTLCLPAALAQPVRPRAAQIAVPNLPSLPPPALMVRQGDRSRPLKIQKVDIAARVVGHLSETTMTLTFFNPNARVMAGDLYFPLQEGATVSGYALDIDGVMIDGVVVDKDRARQVFEAEVRKGVDPGLVEWTGGSNFKTRIFPIPAKGTRTIRVSVVAEVGATGGRSFYHLPLAFADPVGRFSLRLEVVKAMAAPVVAAGGPPGLKFGQTRDSWIAEAKLANAKLTADLFVALPQLDQRPVRVQRAADGRFYFAIRDTVPAPNGQGDAGAPASIAIWWDASASRKTETVARELHVLERYLRSLGQAKVAAWVVTFRDRAERARRFALPADRDALLAALLREDRDGGTQLGAVQAKGNLARVDLNLLFSDGVSNFGDADPSGLKAPVYVINAATTANHPALRHIAARTAGAYFNLQRISAEAAASRIGQRVFGFISARGEGVALERLHPANPTPVQGTFDLAGELTADQAEITLSYGFGRHVTQRRTFAIARGDASDGTLLRRYHAQKAIDDLMVLPERNHAAISAIGRQHSIVTPGTSLIVLERLTQYLQHGIRPPASWAKMRAQYDRAVAQKVVQTKQEEAAKLERIVELWQARLKWWNTTFKPVKIRKERPKKMALGARRMARASAAGSFGGSGGLGLSGSGGGGGGRGMSGAEARESSRSKKKGEVAGRPEATIALKPWDPKTPYLKAMRKVPKARQYAVYLQQRETHGTTPAFFLDCAHHFGKTRQPRLALRVLSNLAELELENPALLRVLGHQLARMDELDLAVKVFETVARLRPEEPQSFRDLALVLARRADRDWKTGGTARAASEADYQRALRLLAKVVMEKWDRFDEIEVIALTELNHILPRARRAGVKGALVDKRLIKQLKMDLRVVMSWDADMTDMDLHVVEPSSEEANYSNNRTKIGGLVSRDFTQGYGPEVYIIRKAMRGKYTLRTKFYGASAAKLAGAVTLQVDVYTNYGRANQKRRSVTLRLTEEKETFTVADVVL